MGENLCCLLSVDDRKNQTKTNEIAQLKIDGLSFLRFGHDENKNYTLHNFVIGHQNKYKNRIEAHGSCAKFNFSFHFFMDFSRNDEQHFGFTGGNDDDSLLLSD